MNNEKWGVLIGAMFGMIFVVVNSGEFPSGITVVLRVLAILAFVGLVGFAFTRGDRGPEPAGSTGATGRVGFSRGYWIVVLAEVIAIYVGILLLNGPLDAPEASVAWIALVVGVHFIGLAVVWKLPFFTALGMVIALCGAVGLVLAAMDASTAAIDAIAGVVPGVLLLAASWWGMLSQPQLPEARG